LPVTIPPALAKMINLTVPVDFLRKNGIMSIQLASIMKSCLNAVAYCKQARISITACYYQLKNWNL